MDPRDVAFADCVTDAMSGARQTDAPTLAELHTLTEAIARQVLALAARAAPEERRAVVAMVRAALAQRLQPVECRATD